MPISDTRSDQNTRRAKPRDVGPSSSFTGPTSMAPLMKTGSNKQNSIELRGFADPKAPLGAFERYSNIEHEVPN
ncbi:hypothetical protein PG997_003121 [Apiospora hydei]|uniref:Uncharacterized protein n=1 Tax=Apiospora hydei TaxID=1337664 RepID=A0ABR1WYB9_9PEZI